MDQVLTQSLVLPSGDIPSLNFVKILKKYQEESNLSLKACFSSWQQADIQIKLNSMTYQMNGKREDNSVKVNQAS